MSVAPLLYKKKKNIAGQAYLCTHHLYARAGGVAGSACRTAL